MAGSKVMSDTFARRVASFGSANIAVVGQISSTRERSADDVGREKLASSLGTTVKFPDTFAG